MSQYAVANPNSGSAESIVPDGSKQFIDEASKLYADALVDDPAEVPALVCAYALISRMRFGASPAVIEKAEASPPHRISSMV